MSRRRSGMSHVFDGWSGEDIKRYKSFNFPEGKAKFHTGDTVEYVTKNGRFRRTGVVQFSITAPREYNYRIAIDVHGRAVIRPESQLRKV